MEAAYPRQKTFGRRKGKKLRAGQRQAIELELPSLTIEPHDLAGDGLPAKFGANCEIFLEIGFGGGEHLVDLASRNPATGCIGCEPFINGVAKLVSAIGARSLSNIRIFPGDAVEVIDALPDASISRVYLLYPDPWPKPRQKKRRFINRSNIERLARVIRPGGVFYFASDIDDYTGWTLAHFAASPSFCWKADEAKDWQSPWPDWPGTRYETKALREGRPPAYLTFTRRDI